MSSERPIFTGLQPDALHYFVILDSALTKMPYATDDTARKIAQGVIRGSRRELEDRGLGEMSDDLCIMRKEEYNNRG